MTMMPAPAKLLLWVFLLLPMAACNGGGESKKADCNTLVTETQSVCMDMMRRGLDVRCDTYLMAVKMAMRQSEGDLFDIGEDNQGAANSFCAVYVKKLRKDRKKHDGSMQAKGKQGPKCTALADRFESECLPKLGKQPLSSKCGSISTSFKMLNTKQFSPKQKENMCAVYNKQTAAN